MDALLGAAALGDIGHLFPDNDPAYEGADSIQLLCEVMKQLQLNGWKLGNADITVLAQAPKLAPHIEKMRHTLASAMQCEVTQVSVKATTEEGLGFTGSGEGISSQAICLLETVDNYNYDPMADYRVNCAGCKGCPKVEMEDNN
jgi:2-C-methyl-D-erythritol 2,4-cyclodiphosphate synthase